MRRLTNPADGRGNLVEITQKGLTRLRAAREERHTVFLDLLCDWSERDQTAFATYLARGNRVIDDRQAGRAGA
ncbi:MAG: hypothetical protein M3Z66_24940 [Chloroflexota bacterium]|nr:hypothetical protein [Chloroflexota bacterium]